MAYRRLTSRPQWTIAYGLTVLRVGDAVAGWLCGVLGLLSAVFPPYLVAGRLRQAISSFTMGGAAAYRSSDASADAHLVKLGRNLHSELAACWTTPCKSCSQRACCRVVQRCSARCTSCCVMCVGLLSPHSPHITSRWWARVAGARAWLAAVMDDVGRVNLRADLPATQRGGISNSAAAFANAFVFKVPIEHQSHLATDLNHSVQSPSVNMVVVHMQQHLHQATGSAPSARPVLSRPAVVTRAAPSPTSMSVSLSGPGQAAEARTDTARGGVASTSVPESTYSSCPDSIKAFLEAELPRLFSDGVGLCCCQGHMTAAQLPATE